MDENTDIFAPLDRVDWEDLEGVSATTSDVFMGLMGQGVLLGLLANIERRPELREMCEHYPTGEKLVLYRSDASDVRVRLHIFHPGHRDKPHNHRWTFASRVLHGAYTHRLYSPADMTEAAAGGGPTVGLRPVMTRVESAGSSYVLHHRQFHTVETETETISVIVRGPAVKERFAAVDRTTRTRQWNYGAGGESRAQRAAKFMDDGLLTKTLDRAMTLLQHTGLDPL
ncbi:hypothetical protein ACIHIX_46030 [Streptomyces sp. NPDC051913]|uniref:hypothetical protein n=1 Tax=Streptomyces sp. NPDC051913 TaxID=3365676 RepID=UPI0037CFF6AC